MRLRFGAFRPDRDKCVLVANIVFADSVQELLHGLPRALLRLGSRASQALGLLRGSLS